jgi:hypothetical protein
LTLPKQGLPPLANLHWKVQALHLRLARGLSKAFWVSRTMRPLLQPEPQNNWKKPPDDPLLELLSVVLGVVPLLGCRLRLPSRLLNVRKLAWT